jgi:RimJ/RimL family protein N-acetyltransferase
MLTSQPPESMRYFTPFSFDEQTISQILSSARQDVYMGLFWEEKLVAFFMLRGWDSGYDVPAYGVTVDCRYSGFGLGRLTLEMSKTICRLRNVQKLMLKVYPENTPAKHLYETAGFIQTGVDPHNNNLIYHYNFSA